MAEAKLLTINYKHSSLPINLLNEHTGFFLNYFLFRYLVSGILFNQNFKYLVLIKNVNFFFHTLFTKTPSPKIYVFAKHAVKRATGGAFRYGKRIGPISRLRTISQVSNLIKYKSNNSKNTPVFNQNKNKKAFSFHPFFNNFGRNLRSNRWYFIGIIPIRFTQLSPYQSYFKYFKRGREVIHPRIHSIRKSFKWKSFRGVLFKKITKIGNRTLYDLFSPHKTEDDPATPLFDKLKYKIKLRSVRRTKLERKAPYKYDINWIWRTPYLFVNKKKKKLKFRMKSYPKYFLMGNVRRFFRNKLKYLDKTKRPLNSFKDVFKSGAVAKIRTKKIKKDSDSYSNHPKTPLYLKKLTTISVVICRTLFLTLRFLLRRKATKYFRRGARFGYIRRFRRKKKSRKLRVVPNYNTFASNTTEDISFLTPLFFKVNFINFDCKPILNTVSNRAVEYNTVKNLSYNKFIKANQVLSESPTCRRWDTVEDGGLPLKMVKDVKSVVLRTTIRKATLNLLSKPNLNNSFSLKHPSKLGVTNFVSLNRVKFVYSKKRLAHQQVVLHSAKRFPLLNFYYRVRRLRKVRIMKLVQLSKKSIASRIYGTSPARRPTKMRGVRGVRGFLNRRKGKLSRIRGKFIAGYSQIVSKDVIIPAPSPNDLVKNLDLRKVHKRKWRILNVKYKKRSGLVRFNLKIRRFRHSRRFRRIKRFKRLKRLKRLKRSKKIKQLKLLKRFKRFKRLNRLKRLKRLKRFKRHRRRKTGNKTVSDVSGLERIFNSKFLKRFNFNSGDSGKQAKLVFSKFSNKLLLIATRLPFATFLTTKKLPYSLHKNFRKTGVNDTSSQISVRNKRKLSIYTIYCFARHHVPYFFKKITSFSTSGEVKPIIIGVRPVVKVNTRGTNKTSLLSKFLNWFSRTSWYTPRAVLPIRGYDYMRLNLTIPTKNFYSYHSLNKSIAPWSAVYSLTALIFSKLRPRQGKASQISLLRKNRPSFLSKTRSNFMLGIYGFYLIFVSNPRRSIDYMRRYRRKLYRGLFSFPDSRSLKKKLLRRFARFKRNHASIFKRKSMLKTAGFSLFGIYNSLKNNLVDYNQDFISNKFSTRTPTKTIFNVRNRRWRRIRRIRFKPGYSKIWRKARTSFKNIWALKFKYQHKLTSYLARTYAQKRGSIAKFTSSNMTLFTTLVRGRFVADTFWSNELIDSNSVYLNSLLATNPKVSLIKGDLIQLLVHIKHYTVLKWQKNLIIIKKARLYKFAKIKSRPKTSRQGADRNYTYPDWIMTLKFMKSDIPAYFEVDYFTLSLFVIYNPLLFQHNYSYEEEIYTPKVLRLYNWKYTN